MGLEINNFVNRTHTRIIALYIAISSSILMGLPSSSLSATIRAIYASWPRTSDPKTFGDLLREGLHTDVSEAHRPLRNLHTCLLYQLRGESDERDLRYYMARLIEKAAFLSPTYELAVSQAIDIGKLSVAGGPTEQTMTEEEHLDMESTGLDHDPENSDRAQKCSDEFAVQFFRFLCAQDPAAVQRDLESLGFYDGLETSSLTLESPPLSIASVPRRVRADAAVVVSTTLSPGDLASRSRACNGLIVFESLPSADSIKCASRDGAATRQTRRNLVVDQFGHGLCRALAALLRGWERCGTWLGLVQVGSRFSRIAIVDGLLVFELLSEAVPFHFHQTGWECSGKDEHNNPIPVPLQEGRTVCVPDLLDQRIDAAFQLAHDMTLGWTSPDFALNLNVCEVQIFLDVLLLASLEFMMCRLDEKLERIQSTWALEDEPALAAQMAGIPECARLPLPGHHTERKITAFTDRLLKVAPLVKARSSEPHDVPAEGSEEAWALLAELRILPVTSDVFDRLLLSRLGTLPAAAAMPPRQHEQSEQ